MKKMLFIFTLALAVTLLINLPAADAGQRFKHNGLIMLAQAGSAGGGAGPGEPQGGFG
ncbi:MAG: hypothetical protein JRJ73_14885, partial [Deltaproteobacteria bacterium]|nr:hypothetical protein [Deltaproteobacteria bacterium]